MPIKHAARIFAVATITLALAAVVIPLVIREVVDYAAFENPDLLEFGTGRGIRVDRPRVGYVSTPRYMHVGDSRAVTAGVDKINVNADVKCELSAPGVIAVALPTELGECSWAVAAKDDGSKLVVTKLVVTQPTVMDLKHHRLRTDRRTYVGWGTIRVAQSPFSAATIGAVASAIAIATSLVALYLQAMGKNKVANEDEKGPKAPKVPELSESAREESRNAESSGDDEIHA